MLEAALKRLAEGCFVCAVHYPENTPCCSKPMAAKNVVSAIISFFNWNAEALFFTWRMPSVTARFESHLHDELRTVHLTSGLVLWKPSRQAQGRHPRKFPRATCCGNHKSTAARR